MLHTLMHPGPSFIFMCVSCLFAWVTTAASSDVAVEHARSVPMIASDAGVPGRAPSDSNDEVYELIPIDTLFYVDNRGLTRILVELNGVPFKFVTDAAEVHRSANAFLIPREGEITVNIAAYIIPDVANYMTITTQGPEGSDAFFLIGDLLPPGQEIAYAIKNLVELPGEFDLLQNYPNPFLDHTTLTYHIPEHRLIGLPVKVTIYDAAGRLVRTLVNDLRYPGTFTAVWDGDSSDGVRAAGGIYFAHLRADAFTKTVKIVRL